MISANWDPLYDYTFFFTGCVVLIKYLHRCLSCVRTYIVSRFFYTRNLAKTYGGRWAVVSGASEGELSAIKTLFRIKPTPENIRESRKYIFHALFTPQC